MALINSTIYRLPFRRSWVYRDNLLFAPSVYSSFSGGAYFLPYVFKRLFEQRQFRDIETFLSHFLVKRFNNNVLYYQFFIQSRFFSRAYRAFQNEFLPHIFCQRRMAEGRGEMFKVYKLLAVLRKKERMKRNKKFLSARSVFPAKVQQLFRSSFSSRLQANVKKKKIETRIRSFRAATTKQLVHMSNKRKSSLLLPSERVIRGLYNQLLLEAQTTTPLKLSKSALLKQTKLLSKIKARINSIYTINRDSQKVDAVNKKKVLRLVSFYNKKVMPLGTKLRRKMKFIISKRKHLLQLEKQKFIVFQNFIRFFEYYTRVFVFNHYKAAVLKTLSSYFQNSKYKYVIDFRFLSLKVQNVYQMLRFMTNRLSQGGNIKHIIRSTQRFYETKGARAKLSGVKLVCSGRFSRQQRAQRLILTSGKVPANTLFSKIDYAASTLRLKYGSSTIKMWLSYE